MIKTKNGLRTLLSNLKKWWIASILGAIAGFLLWKFALIPFIIIMISLIPPQFIKCEITWINAIIMVILTVIMLLICSIFPVTLMIFSIIGGIYAFQEVMEYKEKDEKEKACQQPA